MKLVSTDPFRGNQFPNFSLKNNLTPPLLTSCGFSDVQLIQDAMTSLLGVVTGASKHIFDHTQV